MLQICYIEYDIKRFIFKTQHNHTVILAALVMRAFVKCCDLFSSWSIMNFMNPVRQRLCQQCW